MNYVIAVKSQGYGSQGAFLAYQFAEKLLAKGHSISQVFFFQEGVQNANRFISPASDEVDLLELWKNLVKSDRLSLHLCVSAALRRGITEESVADGFVLAGLGEFSQAVLKADRVVTF